MEILKKVSKVAKGLVSWILSILGVIAILVAAVVLYGNVFGKFQIAPVVSPSMEPEIMTGAILVTTPVPSNTIRVGDVIVFQPCIPGTPETVHRIVEIPQDEGTLKPVIRTKGDNNNAVDPWTCTVQENEVQKYKLDIPYLGKPFIWLQNEQARVYLIIGALVIGAFALLDGKFRKQEEAPEEDDVEPKDPSEDDKI